MSLLKQDIRKKEQIDRAISWLEFENGGNSEKYKVEIISKSAIYANNSKSHLLGLYHPILWNDYSKEKIT